MRRHLSSLLLTITIAVSPAAIADGPTAEGLAPEDIEIPPDIVALATDPSLSPDGSGPAPMIQRTMRKPPRSALFYALPMIGFWLILRRRGRGIRL